MATVKWTPEEDDMMRNLYAHMSNLELANIINAHYGNGRTDKAVLNRSRVLGLRKPKGFKRKCKRTLWTDDRRTWFISFVPGHSEAEIADEFERIFGIRLSRMQIKNAKNTFKVKSGTKGGQFQKGQTPMNKGKTWDEFMSKEGQARSRSTWFKKGEVQDRPDGWIKPIGHERITRDGYTEIKVMDSRIHGIQPHTKGQFNRNYRLKHHVVWEQAHGPIPPNTNIVFADGDKQNFDLDNLVAVPRPLWRYIKQKHLDYYDRESLEACINVARLASAVNEARSRPRDCGVCGHEFAPRFPKQVTCDTCLSQGLRAHRKKKQ